MSARAFPAAPNSKPSQLPRVPDSFASAGLSMNGECKKRIGTTDVAPGKPLGDRRRKLRIERNTFHAITLLIIKALIDSDSEFRNLLHY